MKLIFALLKYCLKLIEKNQVKAFKWKKKLFIVHICRNKKKIISSDIFY